MRRSARSSASLQLQAIADQQIAAVQRAGTKFDDAARAGTSDDRPVQTHFTIGTHDASVRIQEDDVDLRAHAERVYRPAIAKPQSFVGLDDALGNKTR